jgi:hypothetical protein
VCRADAAWIVQRVQGRRSADRELETGNDSEQAAAPEDNLEHYDIDEDFPGEATEEITQTPAAPAVAVSQAPDRQADPVRDSGEFAPMSGIAAHSRRRLAVPKRVANVVPAPPPPPPVTWTSRRGPRNARRRRKSCTS